MFTKFEERTEILVELPKYLFTFISNYNIVISLYKNIDCRNFKA